MKGKLRNIGCGDHRPLLHHVGADIRRRGGVGPRLPQREPLYMTVVMVAPMVIVMLTAMSHMFRNKRLNVGVYAVSVAVFLAAFFAIRTQAFVGDEQLVSVDDSAPLGSHQDL